MLALRRLRLHLRPLLRGVRLQIRLPQRPNPPPALLTASHLLPLPLLLPSLVRALVTALV